MVPVLEQFHSFFFAVAVGMIIGFILDGYRSLCFRRRPRPLATAAGDLLLWLFLTGFVFFLLLLNNWGEVRAYVFLSMTLGFLVYRKLFSSFVFRCWNKLFFVIESFLRLLLWIIVLPVKVLQKILFLPLGLVSMVLDWLVRFLGAVARRAGIRPRTWWAGLQKLWQKKDK